MDRTFFHRGCDNIDYIDRRYPANQTCFYKDRIRTNPYKEYLSASRYLNYVQDGFNENTHRQEVALYHREMIG
jgi:hypothetical protein